MPTFLTRPERPSIKYGVWARGGSPASGQEFMPVKVGYSIHPTYGVFMPENYERSAMEARLPHVLQHFERTYQARIRNLLPLPAALQGRIITNINVSGDRLAIYLDGSTEASVKLRTRYYWDTLTLRKPHDGPYEVKRMLANHKAFRLTDGTSIEIHGLRGKFKIAALSETFVEECYGS